MRVLSMCIFCMILSAFTESALAQDERDKVITVVREFFYAIEKNDSVGFNNVFLPDARIYVSRMVNDTVQTVSRPAVGKSIFKKGVQYLESMRQKGVKVEMHQQMAMAWVPYDFHVNNAFSHCGIDVFTFMKTKTGWKIATLSYSVEKTACDTW